MFCALFSVASFFGHIIAERDENTCRLGFTPSEQVAVGMQIEAMEKPKAAKRRKAGKAPCDNLSQGQDGTKTRTKAAAAAGMSEGTYAKAKQVVQAAEEDPEKYVESGDATRGQPHPCEVEGGYEAGARRR